MYQYLRKTIQNEKGLMCFFARGLPAIRRGNDKIKREPLHVPVYEQQRQKSEQCPYYSLSTARCLTASFVDESLFIVTPIVCRDFVFVLCLLCSA